MTLDKKYIKKLEDTLTGITRLRLLLGKWVQAEGVIYDCFSFEKNVIELNMVDEAENFKFFFGGADSNFPKPRAGLIFGLRPNGDIVVVDEFYRLNSHPEDLGKWFSQFAERYKTNVDIFHDPADPDAIAKIDMYNYISCDKANNKVLPGIDIVYRLLKEGRLKINKNCTDLISFLQTYKWKTTDKQAPDKKDDHLPDALRYGLATYDREYGSSSEEISDATPVMM